MPELLPHKAVQRMNLITRTKGVVSGAYRLTGTRIPVTSIKAISETRGITPVLIQRLYPQLSMEQIHAALAFREKGTP